MASMAIQRVVAGRHLPGTGAARLRNRRQLEGQGDLAAPPRASIVELVGGRKRYFYHTSKSVIIGLLHIGGGAEP